MALCDTINNEGSIEAKSRQLLAGINGLMSLAYGGLDNEHTCNSGSICPIAASVHIKGNKNYYQLTVIELWDITERIMEIWLNVIGIIVVSYQCGPHPF